MLDLDGLHVGDHPAAEPEHVPQVEVDDRVPLLGGPVLQVLPRGVLVHPAGDVGEHVDPAQLGNSRVDRPLRGGFVAQIGNDRDRSGARLGERGHHSVGALGFEVDDGNRRARGREDAGGRLADAAPAARDHRHLVGEQREVGRPARPRSAVGEVHRAASPIRYCVVSSSRRLLTSSSSTTSAAAIVSSS